MTRKLWWRVTTRSSRSSPLLMGAVLIFFASAVLIAVVLVPQLRATNRLEQEAAALPPASSAIHMTSEPDNPEQQLERFDRLLPAVRDIPAILASIRAAAKLHGVDLPEGQLKLVQQPDQRFAQYQMVFPFQAPYTSTREFVREAMAQVPTLALDQMSFQRANSATQITDVHVEFTLFVRTSTIGSPS